MILELIARHPDGRQCRHRTIRPAIEAIADELRGDGYRLVWLPLAPPPPPPPSGPSKAERRRARRELVA